jgi:ComF family protein
MLPAKEAGDQSMRFSIRLAIDDVIVALDNLLFLETCRLCAKKCLPKHLSDRYPKSICFACFAQLVDSKPLFEWKNNVAIASVSAYQGKMKELIHKLKYENDRLLAYDLACLMLAAWTDLRQHVNLENLLIVPIPLHKQKLRSRGFNQAQLLAKHLSQALQIDLAGKALTRAKNTKPQFGLSRPERLANLTDAFAGNKTFLAGKTVILVDDIYTSGATVAAAASEVMNCSAKAVAALTLARA